jgi:hypothetical protein
VGNNSQGVAGDGGTANKTTWTVIASSNFDSKTPRAVYLAGKADLTESAMMITTEGKIYGTGNNDKGQLGVGDTTDKTTWTAATGDIASQTVTRLACSDRATFALDSTGNVWSCGNSVFVGQGLSDDDTDLTTFTKITKPTEFLSKTIVNIVGLMQGLYAVDSEGNLWGTGVLMGLGTAGVNANLQLSFAKVPIYDVVPKEFKYTPTLTLENPNPDYGATVEFKNPNNRAFINLDDKTSTLRLGFVNNENNAGQFRGLEISPTHAPLNYPWCARKSNAWQYNASAGVDVTYTSTYDPYNLWNGTRYKCPVDGVYVAFFDVMVTNGNETGVLAYLIRTDRVILNNGSTTFATIGNSTYDIRSFSGMARLYAGEEIYFNVSGYNGAYFDVHPNNAGAYIYLVTRC